MDEESPQYTARPDNDRIAQRLADASIVIGRAAHDFDNLLTGIHGFAELMAPMIPENSLLAKYVIELVMVARRGQELTSQMHDLSRGGVATSGVTPISEAWTKLWSAVQNEWPTEVVLNVEFPPDLPPVRIGPEPLARVFRVVLDNAREAANPTGTIRISAWTAAFTIEQLVDVYGSCRPGRFVVISVADGGRGIAPEHREKLFVQPFFTTKYRHRGLGLAIAYRVLHAHGGGLRLTSDPSGTSAEILVPSAESEPETRE